ncbi:MAG TPA: class I SAM-dependent methyltransferase [Ilumatobacteraceae bacterium]|nr:class I SAM-dependent methyltransferase [Ilumatobacteraceae bacterium]
MTTTYEPAIDPARIEAFAGRLMGIYTGAVLTYMIDLGHRTGLFSAAAQGPASSAGLAVRAGLTERYVREWLGSMAAAGFVDYDPVTGVFELPAEHAACLTGPGSSNLARFSQMTTHLGQFTNPVAQAFRDGGGVPYSAFVPEFTDVMDAASRNGFDEHLLTDILPLVPGLPEQLATGARVADIGCGTGHAIALMAAAYPDSTFIGYDLSEPALERAEAEIAAAGVTNAHYELGDVASLTVDVPFDAVVSFDTIHDQARPEAVLRAVHDALKPGGVYVMVEPRVSSNLEDNIGNPMAPLIYGVSTLHCLTVSLAQDGAGLGTAFGEQVARRLLADAGFVGVEVHPAPGDPLDAVFVARKPV